MKTPVSFLLAVLAASTVASAQTPAPSTAAPSTPVAATPVAATPAAQPAAASRADQSVIDNSRATWEGYKTKNVAAIKALTAPRYPPSRCPARPISRRTSRRWASWEILSFTIDEPIVTWAGKNVAILRYKNDLKGSFDGKAFKPVYASEVWFNEGGKWRIISYTETPVAPTT